MRRSVLAGATGGFVAFVLMAFLAAMLMRRAMPAMMPRMMKKMMEGGCCSDEMRACMEKCGGGRAAASPPDPA